MPITADEHTPSTDTGIDRDQAIKAIRKALRAKTGRAWSVTGGRGTSWGWITITAPPARRDQYGSMVDIDRAALAEAIGVPVAHVHSQGILVPNGTAARREILDALGATR